MMNITIADIKNTVSLISSVLALIISVLSIFYTMSIKSYEILINERMQIYQKIKDCFQNLRGLTTKFYILKCCEQNKSDDYCQQLRDEYNRLESLLSQTEPQEFFLMQQVKKLIDMAVGIYESLQQCNGLHELEKEAKITFLFADIYCWTLWVYIQSLHKLWGRLASYHRLFDKSFKKIYKRAKRLHMGQNPEFFNNYPLEMILGNSIQEEHREEQQQEQQLQDSGK